MIAVYRFGNFCHELRIFERDAGGACRSACRLPFIRAADINQQGIPLPGQSGSIGSGN